jgi:hypothetical protein
MALENYGRIMQGAADFAMQPYNALQDARREQRTNTLLDLRAQGMQNELDDDAEWDQAYANRDINTMMRIDPRAAQPIAEMWQAEKMSGLEDIPLRQKIDVVPLQRQENWAYEQSRLLKNDAADNAYRSSMLRLAQSRDARASAPPEPQSLATDGNGNVVDYGKTTDGERTAVGYLDRIVSARKRIESPELAGYVPSLSSFMAFASLLDDDTGVIGAAAANKLLNDADRQYMGQALDLILAKMRKESGATIKGGEFRKEYINLFPMPNDSPKVLADKKLKRQLAENQLWKAAGRAAGPLAVQEAAETSPDAVAAPAPSGAVVNWDDL